MNMSGRPVDHAMLEERPEKQAIRLLWLNEVREIARKYPDSEVPWYLTLSGAQGHDIQLIVNEGLISITEVNSIAEKDQFKVVAVERSNTAILELQRRFIGLRIKEVDFRELIRGEGIFSWPKGKDEDICRAHIVNLDLNTPLNATHENEGVIFPVLEWIKKLCQIHGRYSRTEWILCLTLHGEINWPRCVNHWTKNFLRENFRREQLFANNCRAFLGDDFYETVSNDDNIDFTRFSRHHQQKFIMVIVPKIITRLVHNEGWQVRTEKNLSYGQSERAPMVTWIVKFTWAGEAIATPDAMYRSALCDIFSNIGIVTENGEILCHQL